MANKKITQLTSLPQSQFAAGDTLPIVDISSNETKRTTVDELDLRWAAKTHDHSISDITSLQTSLDGKEGSVTATSSTDYYRGDKTFQTLDKNAVGLNNVDNVSDTDKPVSTSQALADTAIQNYSIQRANHSGTQAISTVTSLQTTLDAKLVKASNLSDVASISTARTNLGLGSAAQNNTGDFTPVAHAGNTSNPHSVTKSQVGLNNVDNTSDINKPVSNLTQTALNNKANTSHSHVSADITDFAVAVQAVGNSDKLLSEHDDFTSATVAGKLNMVSTVAGTSAAITLNNVISDTSVFGNRQLTTGVTAVGRATYSLSIDSTYFSTIQHSIEWKCQLPNISTVGVEQFFAHIGWGDVTASGDHVDGVYFKYDATISNNWLAISASNSVRETTDTGVAVNISWNKFNIVVNNTATQALFYINGVLVATNTLNIPSSQARACGPLVKIEKQIGLLARTLQVDRVQIDSRRP